MKACLLICNKNAVSGKDTFPFIKDKILTIGYTIPKDYDQPPGDEPKSLQGLTRWITTLATPDKPPLVLTSTYSPEKYPKYENYDAINVNSVKDIPYDYEGVIGCPITILEKNLDNVVIEGLLYGEYTEIDGEYIKGHRPILNGKQMYSRVLIKHLLTSKK